jgi:hypothetical protein
MKIYIRLYIRAAMLFFSVAMATVHTAILFPVRQAVAVAVAMTSLFPAKQPYLPNYKTLSRQKGGQVVITCHYARNAQNP